MFVDTETFTLFKGSESSPPHTLPPGPCFPQVHHPAAAVQPRGPRGARLSGAARHHPLGLRGRAGELQPGLHALGPAADHHGPDAPGTHAPSGRRYRWSGAKDANDNDGEQGLALV